MINTTISEFGKILKFDNLSFNEDHIIHLELKSIGDLFIEDSPPYLLMYLSTQCENLSSKTYQKALTLCHYKQKNPYPTYTGLYEDNKLSFLIRIPYEEISESNLEKAVLFLIKLQNQITNINKT